MKFYAGRWNHVSWFGTEVDKLEEKINQNTYRYRIGDYNIIENRKELKEITEFKEGDMYVCGDEVWVSTGEEYEWYRYKVMNNTNSLIQRIKLVENENVRIKHSLQERITYRINPSIDQRKNNKKSGKGYLTKSEKNSVKVISIFIGLAIIIEMIKILF